MALAESFQEILDSLPDDWTDLTLDFRLPDEDRYIDAAVILTQVNAQPYSKADWHWRILVANKFGHAAAAQTVKGTLELLDGEGIEGEMVLRDFREGRAEVNADVGPAGVGPPAVPAQPPALRASEIVRRILHAQHAELSKRLITGRRSRSLARIAPSSRSAQDRAILARRPQRTRRLRPMPPSVRLG